MAVILQNEAAFIQTAQIDVAISQQINLYIPMSINFIYQ